MLPRKGDFRAPSDRSGRGRIPAFGRPEARIAGVYIEFADALFKPPKDAEKPDYGGRLEFYQRRWRRARNRRNGSRWRCSGPMPAATGCERRGRVVPTIHPEPRRARAGDRGPVPPGRVLVGNRDLKQARRVWQDLLAAYPDSRSRAGGRGPVSACPHVEHPPAGDRRAVEPGRRRRCGRSWRGFPPTNWPAPRISTWPRVTFIRGRHEDAAAILRQFVADPRYRELRRDSRCLGPRWAAATSCKRNTPRRSPPGASTW